MSRLLSKTESILEYRLSPMVAKILGIIPTTPNFLVGSNFQPLISIQVKNSPQSSPYFEFTPHGSDCGSFLVIEKERAGIGQSVYIGQILDQDTGLNYLNARYLKSSVGQFINEDPVFWGNQNLQDPQSLNSYAYVEDNPINKVDPSGKQLADAMQQAPNFTTMTGMLLGSLGVATLPEWALPAALIAVTAITTNAILQRNNSGSQTVSVPEPTLFGDNNTPPNTNPKAPKIALGAIIVGGISYLASEIYNQVKGQTDFAQNYNEKTNTGNTDQTFCNARTNNTQNQSSQSYLKNQGSLLLKANH